MATSINDAVEAEKDKSSDVEPASPLSRPLVDVAGLLRSAIRRRERKLESVGFEIGYSPSYWTRVLSCERGLTLDRLGRLPVDVQHALLAAWGAALNANVPNDTAQPPVGVERRRNTEWQSLTQLVATGRVRVTLEGA